MKPDDQLLVPPTDNSRHALLAALGAAVLFMAEVRSRSGSSTIDIITIGGFFGVMTWLVRRRATNGLAILFASMSVVVVLLFTVSLALRPGLAMNNVAILSLIFGVGVIGPGILAFVLFTKRVRLPAIEPVSHTTPEDRARQFRYFLLAEAAVVGMLCLSLVSNARSSVALSPIRLYAEIVVISAIGIDVALGIRRFTNSSH